METKRCSICKEFKSLDEFYLSSYRHKETGEQSPMPRCKKCTYEMTKDWLKKNEPILKEKRQEWYKTRVAKDSDFCRRQKLRHWEIKLGLPRGWFHGQYKKQQGLCGICGKPETTNGTRKHTKLDKRMAIDHSHETGKVRGLLCMSCNTKLAVLENAEFAAQARAYLTQY